jgi:hypothetical protein
MHPRSQVTFEEIEADVARALRDALRAQLGTMLPNPPEPEPERYVPPSKSGGSSGFVEINWLPPPLPPPPAKLTRTENLETAVRRLEKLKVPWSEFRFDWDRFYGDYGVSVRIAPSISVHDVSGQRDTPVRLQGHTASMRLDTPVRELVATARRLAIALFEHELDEWLANAGLCEDPHVLQRFRQQSRGWFQRPKTNWYLAVGA